jgi:hypothetical protein
MSFQAGEVVQVRSKEEILATLDKDGRLEGLPFMPQMFEYCGKSYKVYKRAHKTCDTVSGKLEIRKLPSTVHLEHRCDGKAYGGCQADCLIFWKEAWLRPIGKGTADMQSADQPAERVSPSTRCTLHDVMKGTKQNEAKNCGETRYACQATQLLHYSAPLKWWDPRQYIEDYRSGNATLRKTIGVFAFFAYRYGTFAKSETLGRPARWFYDRVQRLRGGVPYPKRKGTIPVGQPVPNKTLNLRPGEFVRVKSYVEILDTINTRNRHLGLWFDSDMVPYCGRIYRVRARVKKFIDEPTGCIKELKTPAIILEGVVCQSNYTGKRMICPRAIFPWWREVWLERVNDDPAFSSQEITEAATPKAEECIIASQRIAPIMGRPVPCAKL